MDGLNTPDAVAQARMHVEMYRNPMAFSDDEFAEYVDALIAAVRAECAAKVREKRIKEVEWTWDVGFNAGIDAAIVALEAQP